MLAVLQLVRRAILQTAAGVGLCVTAVGTVLGALSAAAALATSAARAAGRVGRTPRDDP